MTTYDDVVRLQQECRYSAEATRNQILDAAVALRDARLAVIDHRRDVVRQIIAAARSGERALLRAASGSLDLAGRAAVIADLKQLHLNLTPPAERTEAAVLAIRAAGLGPRTYRTEPRR